jgi:hypothetical protein
MLVYLYLLQNLHNPIEKKVFKGKHLLIERVVVAEFKQFIEGRHV